MRTARILAVLAAVLACALLAAAGPASAAVLVDQTDAAGNFSSGSQDGPGGYDDETADDFVVPAGVQWTVGEVDVFGGGYGTPSTAQSIDVAFYADALGAPGAEVFRQTLSAYSGRPDFVLPLAPAAVLASGTYWVSVRVGIGDGTPGSEWFWTGRTTVSGAKAAYRTQSGSGAFSAWSTRSTAPDQIFKLAGSAGPVPSAPAPVVTVTPAPAPVPSAPAPSAPAPAAAAPAFAKLVTLPPASRCVSRRKLRLSLHAPKGTSIAKTTIKVAGRAAKVVRGKALTAPVDLTGLPRGRHAVKVTVTLADGRTISGTRTYRTCAAKAKH